jgi:stage II sporulation protein D
MRTRRTPTRTTAVGLIASAVVLVAGPSDALHSTPGLQVPDNATLTVAGHGWGHGHGLSQYGAEGAARKGLNAQQIVRFYYPHTVAGTVGGAVTVLISADTDLKTTVVARPGLEVRDLAQGTTVPVPTTGRPSKATLWKMSGDGHGATEVSYRTDTWHVWRTLTGNGEFQSTGARLTLVIGKGRVTYRGTLRSLAPDGAGTQRITVNRVSLEGYVRGVVPVEMPASWHQAALRAQAIAARTYAAFEARSSTNPRFELCDTSACQVYGGMSAEQPTSNEAVLGTARQVRLYQGAPAFTQFSSSNGGWTADGGEPYLDAHADPYDGWSGNPMHSWSTTVTARSIEKHWPGIGNLASIAVDQRDGHGQWNGRIEELTLYGSNGSRQVTGPDFQAALGLRSTWIHLAVTHGS